MNATLDANQQKTDLPNVNERRQIHLINPTACGGKHAAAAKRLAEQTKGEVVLSQYSGFAEDYAAELFSKDPYAHLVVYGGDGTICETVNGIMKSGNNHTASFSVIPTGSGNDFSAYANDGAGFKKAELQHLDLCRANDRYFINVMNIGFDCNVVERTVKLKHHPLVPSSMAYSLGVVSTLMHKMTTDMHIELEDGEIIERPLLLMSIANGQFYGGGFRVAPVASVTDGLMDVLVVDDITRAQFMSLVKYYHDGTFINEQGQLLERFKKILRYEKCRKLRMEGPRWFCIDGEVFPTGGAPVTVENVKGAVWFAAL